MSAFLKSIGRGPVLLAAAALAVIAGAGFLTSAGPGMAAEDIVIIPPPAVDAAAKPAGTMETAIFAGGCFWGVQGVFQHVKGVDSAISGYSGGMLQNPKYEDVLTEKTGHAEAVKVVFDPSQVSYGKLLQIFFSVTHNPTQLNYQGPDHGPSYRSALFFTSDEQEKVAKAYIAQLDATKKFPDKIVTEVTKFAQFWQAEDYHQDATTTININPGYIRHYDLPKIANLKATFPEQWSDKARLVFAKNGK
jgi:peptide-methionine (S)-S-oxide reductase